MRADAAGCLSEQEVLDFVRGSLAGATLARAERHIAECSECRQLVSILARASAPEGGLERYAKEAASLVASGAVGAYDPTVASGKGDARPMRAKQDSMPVTEGDLLAGKYRVERVLGSGGMGVVVSAMHEQLGQRVALKFLLPTACAQPGAVARFLREARAAVQIQSEHVARVLDVGTLDGGAPYLVMEFLRGTDLAEVVKQRGPLPIEEVCDYLLQACEAIAEAHKIGIVHRDLKPANLFLTTRTDGTPFVKVLDFGISKVSAPEMMGGGGITSAETMMGSPRYMSPEQMRSAKDVDARADVWALGVLLYELATSQPPFEAETFAGLCAAIQTAPAPRLRGARAEAPEALEELVLRCLEKDVTRRLPSVAGFVEALGPFAPARARGSVERVQRLLGPSAPPPPLASVGDARRTPGGHASTGGGFGRTSPEGREARASAAPRPGRRGLVVAVVAAVAAVVTGLTLRARTPDERAPDTAAATPGGGGTAPGAPAERLGRDPAPTPAAGVGRDPAGAAPSSAGASGAAGDPPHEANDAPGAARAPTSAGAAGAPVPAGATGTAPGTAARPGNDLLTVRRRPRAPAPSASASAAPAPTTEPRDTQQSGLTDRK